MSARFRSPMIRFALVVAAGALACACGSGSAAPKAATSGSATSSTTTSSTTTTPTTAAPSGPTAAQMTAEANGATSADTDPAGVEWLCRPNQSFDPCDDSLTATVVPQSLNTSVQNASDATNPPIDCFYVYPTVSSQQTILANLHIDPAEIATAKAQASRFSEDCRVFAPMYEQLTLHAIFDTGAITAQDELTAYNSVLAAWNDYLAHYNDGRGVVLIGHSQGSALLITLMRDHIDDNPSVRRRLVSAVILGGNVEVPIGKNVGGTFQNIPACRSTTQIGCVVAYSSFDTEPPSDSLFGRAGKALLSNSGPTLPPSELQVLCVNPASPSGGSATLDPYFPTTAGIIGGTQVPGTSTAVSTPWVTEPDLYTGQCMYEDGASWLQISGPINAGDPRPLVKESLGPTWGLHLVDVNIALGNLVALVKQQAQAYKSSQ
ncbi:MAG: DUF3089 domain-containing protein [Acidimicrobiales bacterium]